MELQLAMINTGVFAFPTAPIPVGTFPFWMPGGSPPGCSGPAGCPEMCRSTEEGGVASGR